MPRPFLGTRRSKSSAPGTSAAGVVRTPATGSSAGGGTAGWTVKEIPLQRDPAPDGNPRPILQHQNTSRLVQLPRFPGRRHIYLPWICDTLLCKLRNRPSLAEHGELSCFRISDKVFSEPTSPGVKLDALAHTTAVRQGTVILQEAAAGDLVGVSNADTVYIRLHVLGHDAHIDQG